MYMYMHVCMYMYSSTTLLHTWFSFAKLSSIQFLDSPSLEIPFKSGKVFGLWYVGNTVYTVSQTLIVTH